MTATEQEWADYPHWYCEHGALQGFGCDQHDDPIDDDDCEEDA